MWLPCLCFILFHFISSHLISQCVVLCCLLLSCAAFSCSLLSCLACIGLCVVFFLPKVLSCLSLSCFYVFASLSFIFLGFGQLCLCILSRLYFLRCCLVFVCLFLSGFGGHFADACLHNVFRFLFSLFFIILPLHLCGLYLLVLLV
jgi:hypothetical protein